MVTVVASSRLLESSSVRDKCSIKTGRLHYRRKIAAIVIFVVLINAVTKGVMDEMKDGKIELLSSMVGVAATPVVETPADTPAGEFK